MKVSFRYRLDGKIRSAVMWVLGLLVGKSVEENLDLRRLRVRKILLVRGIFRMGDSILSTPAIFLFRKNFPAAQIDFVGSPMSKRLFAHLPIDHHYEVQRKFPMVCWSYLALLTQIRSKSYDLAVDVSGSSSALSSFIVGFSGARFRAGLLGKWDRWFNLRYPRPIEINKYKSLPELIGAMGLRTEKCLPTLMLSHNEKTEGRRRIDALAVGGRGPVVGMFVGGRKARGKRWPKRNFIELAAELRAEGARVLVFVGPEERELAEYFRDVLNFRSAVVFEPDPRRFASLIAHCDLFVACDSGPLHLACALRTRTVAIFLRHDFDRWGPLPSLARIVYGQGGVSPEHVMNACCDELAHLSFRPEERKIANG
jgi:heptosyltransferase-3